MRDAKTETETKLSAPQPSVFIDADELLRRIPICRGTLRNRMREGKIPFIRIGGRKLCFHWNSVQEALLRQQRGGEA